MLQALGTEPVARATDPHTVLQLGSRGLPFSGGGSCEGPQSLCDLVFWVKECTVHTTRAPHAPAEPCCPCWETPPGFICRARALS